MRHYGISDKTWNNFCTLLPNKSIAVWHMNKAKYHFLNAIHALDYPQSRSLVQTTQALSSL
jgi:hypothetical protein